MYKPDLELLMKGLRENSSCLYLDENRLKDAIKSRIKIKNENHKKLRETMNRTLIDPIKMIPSDCSGLQDKYFNFALEYFENIEYPLENPNDISSVILSDLTNIWEMLLSPNKLKEKLGNSHFYEHTAHCIMDFYEAKKDKLDLLARVGQRIYQGYYTILHQEPVEKDSSLVKKVWDDISKR